MTTTRRSILTAIPALYVPSLSGANLPPEPPVCASVVGFFRDSALALYKKLTNRQATAADYQSCSAATQLCFDYLHEIGYDQFLSAYISSTILPTSLTANQYANLVGRMSRTVPGATAGPFPVPDVTQRAEFVSLADASFAAAQDAFARQGPQGLSIAIVNALNAAANHRQSSDFGIAAQYTGMAGYNFTLPSSPYIYNLAGAGWNMAMCAMPLVLGGTLRA